MRFRGFQEVSLVRRGYNLILGSGYQEIVRFLQEIYAQIAIVTPDAVITLHLETFVNRKSFMYELRFQDYNDLYASCSTNLSRILLFQIYTDWANHYLEKSRSKKRVNSLASDCSDGVLLAEVIESVTCQKIPDINRKPKTPSQMLENINLCLNVLRSQHVAGVDGVSAQELRDGKLKAILALFFALSRHKQAAKARAQQHQQLGDMTPNR
ncbi:hypothetical protein JTB14_025886 [Gonioctena quinquepunctata]|nr:hypothetical protein JTB14_025886 [Gonioctena quinquepunctata]